MNINTINYPIISRLKKSFKNTKRNMEQLETINICCYNINNSLEKPFLQYLLYKDCNTFKFPWIKYDKDKDINELCIDKLKSFFKNKQVKLYGKGFIHNKKSLYFFVEFKLELDIHLFNEKDSLLFCTMYEIINERKILYYDIDKLLYDFFIENPDTIFLYNSEELIEIPCVFYNGCQDNKIGFYKLFNINKSGFYSVFGPFYYFTTSISCIKWAGWLQYSEYSNILSNDVVNKKTLKFKKGNIIRCVLFLGNLLVKPTKHSDLSDNTKYLINQKINSYSKYESDRNFQWIQNYDSILLNSKQNKLIIATKSLRNVKILTYHKLDMNSIPDKYNSKINSFKIL